jgi:transcriptional regulator with XRE-family HTH domain
VDWFYKEFGIQLKIARKNAGLTQAKLGKRMALSRVSITNIERGVQHFPAHMLPLFAKAVGVELKALIPTHPTNEIVSQKLLGDVSAVTQQWIQKVVASTENNSAKEKNEQKRRSRKEAAH